MANALKGEVSLPLGDDTFTLIFDIDAICAAEEALDMPVEDILAQLNAKRRKMTVMRAVLWAGLQQRHPELSLVEVGQKFFGPGGLGILGVLVYVAEALNKAFPKPGEAASGEADPQSPAVAGIGSGSSASGAS